MAVPDNAQGAEYVAPSLVLGDCVEVMATMAAASVDSIVTDPPYGLEFMGNKWDRLGDIGASKNRGMSTGRFKGMVMPESYNADVNVKCAKCGRWRKDHLPRRCICAEPEFPNVKAYQAQAMQAWHEAWITEAFRVLKPGGHLLAFGGTRTYHRMVCAIEDAGFEIRDSLHWFYGTGFPKSNDPAKKDARVPEGLGTALKPAHEPIVLARKPLLRTVAANVVTHGTGALNIDVCRNDQGRWPPNVALDEAAAAEVGKPSRFFYVAKPSRAERDSGLVRNTHPTVKPVALMRWLVRLITPPGGLVLDPFVGSGTTGVAAHIEGYCFVGIDENEEYLAIAQARLDTAAPEPTLPFEEAS